MDKLFLLICIPFSLFSLSLDEAVEHTLNTNPQMQKSISDYIAIQQDLSVAESDYKPTLDFNAAIGKEESDKDRVGDSVSLTRKETGLVANQNLFRGFQTKYDVKEQEARIKASRYTALQTANTIALRTTEVYIQVLQQKKILDLLLSNVKTHERIYKMIKEKTDAGMSKRSDLEQTHGRLALAYANYISQQNNYQDTLINFERVYGRVLSASDFYTPTMPDLPASSQSKLIHIAQKYSPTLIVERSNIKTIESQYEKEKSSFYPTVDLELSGDWNKDIDGVQGKDNSYKAMLKLNYNLYNGGSDEAVRIKNMQLISSEQELLNEQERAVIEKVKLAYMSEQILKSEIRCLKIHAKQTRTTADAYAQEYQLGRRTLLDLLNTELEYNSAQQSLQNAMHDRLYARYRVLEASGILSLLIENSAVERVDVFKPDAFLSTKDNELLELIGETDEFIDMGNICQENEALGTNALLDINTVQSDSQEIAVALPIAKIPGTNIPATEYLYFGYKVSEATSITPNYINRLVDVLKSDEEHNVMILGHTDDIGSKKYNFKLSQKRANSVKNILVSKGVDASRITAIGVGEDHFISSNSTEAGRKLNRRVEISVKKN